MIPITTVFLVACVIMFSVLSMRVIKGRRSKRILIGDGGDDAFLFLQRGHANFAEYVPIALLALGAAELAGAHTAVLVLAGTLLIVGRVLHAFYFFENHEGLKPRVRGMQCTFFAIWIATAAAAVYTALNHI